MAKETSSLVAFAGDIKMTAQQLSEKPEWTEAVAGYHAGIPAPTIRRWLITEKGYADKALPSAESINKYLRNHHARG